MLSFANARSAWDLFCTNILHILSKYNLSLLLKVKWRNYLSCQIRILDLPFKHSYSLNAIKCGTIILVSFLLTFSAEIQALCSVVSKIATIYWGVCDSHFCISLTAQLTNFLRKWPPILSPLISFLSERLVFIEFLTLIEKWRGTLRSSCSSSGFLSLPQHLCYCYSV